MAPVHEPPARSAGDGRAGQQAYAGDSQAAVLRDLVAALRVVASGPASELPNAIEAGREHLRQVQRAEAARGDLSSIVLADACSLLLDVLDELAKSIETAAMEAVRRERQRIVEILTALDDEPPAAERRPLPEGGRQWGPLAHPLTPQERVVLGLLAEGAGTLEIAEALTISATTAKKHVCNVLEKLGASDRLKAVVRAQALGLLPDGNRPPSH